MRKMIALFPTRQTKLVVSFAGAGCRMSSRKEPCGSDANHYSLAQQVNDALEARNGRHREYCPFIAQTGTFRCFCSGPDF